MVTAMPEVGSSIPAQVSNGREIKDVLKESICSRQYPTIPIFIFRYHLLTWIN